MPTDPKSSHLDFVKPIPVEELDGSPVRPAAPGVRWEARALAASLDHPKRNGFLMMVAGFVVEATTVGMMALTGKYFPAAIPVGSSIACLGAWLVVVPVPVGAKAKILGESNVGGRGWVAWELGAGAMILIGGAVGIAALLDISMP